MRIYNWIVIGLAVVYALVFLSLTSIPGGASGPGFDLILAFVPLLLAYIVLAVLSWAYSRFMSGLWVFPLVMVLAVLLARADILEPVHWRFIKSDLESAVANGSCPSWAGAARVHACTELAGGKAFDLNGGFLDTVYLVKDALEIPPNQQSHVVRELGDGWNVVSVDF